MRRDSIMGAHYPIAQQTVAPRLAHTLPHTVRDAIPQAALDLLKRSRGSRTWDNPRVNRHPAQPRYWRADGRCTTGLLRSNGMIYTCYSALINSDSDPDSRACHETIGSLLLPLWTRHAGDHRMHLALFLNRTQFRRRSCEGRRTMSMTSRFPAAACLSSARCWTPRDEARRDCLTDLTPSPDLREAGRFGPSSCERSNRSKAH